METRIFFALWAEDINAYLSTGYNLCKLSDIKNALIDYISVDQDNPEKISDEPISHILAMTGLGLDFLQKSFIYRNKGCDEPYNARIGNKVHAAFIS